MSNEKELQDSQQPDQELDLELELEDTSEEGKTVSTEDVETLRQRLAESEKKRRQLFARLKQREEEKQSINLPKESQDNGDAGIRLSRLEMAEAKRQFGYEHGLSPEETDKVFSITPKPTKETLDDPFIKAGLEAVRKARRVVEATPSPSGRSTTFNGKSFAELSEEDRKKAYESRLGG